MRMKVSGTVTVAPFACRENNINFEKKLSARYTLALFAHSPNKARIVNVARTSRWWLCP